MSAAKHAFTEDSTGPFATRAGAPFSGHFHAASPAIFFRGPHGDIAASWRGVSHVRGRMRRERSIHRRVVPSVLDRLKLRAT
jgi:hypothetical protein